MIHFSTPATHVALLEIDNPPMNALGRVARAALLARLDEIDAAKEARAVVLTGRGRRLLQRRRPEGTGRGECTRLLRAFR